MTAQVSAAPSAPYAARLNIDYPERLDRVSTFFRLIWIIPIAIVLGLLTASGNQSMVTASGQQVAGTGGGLLAGLAVATALMIVVRLRYPRWWFDFARELTRFGARVSVYMALLTDRYPSTVDEQSVHLEIEYPDVERDLNRWLPLVKWLLAIPHYVVLAFLWVGAIIAIVIAWFAILVTGRYPRPLFDYVVGVSRWTLRVSAYAFLLVTDRYPPFSLREAA
jgi:membrane protein YdbS with pleckstrin-like domain